MTSATTTTTTTTTAAAAAATVIAVAVAAAAAVPPAPEEGEGAPYTLLPAAAEEPLAVAGAPVRRRQVANVQVAPVLPPVDHVVVWDLAQEHEPVFAVEIVVVGTAAAAAAACGVSESR